MISLSESASHNFYTNKHRNSSRECKFHNLKLCGGADIVQAKIPNCWITLPVHARQLKSLRYAVDIVSLACSDWLIYRLTFWMSHGECHPGGWIGLRPPEIRFLCCVANNALGHVLTRCAPDFMKFIWKPFGGMKYFGVILEKWWLFVLRSLIITLGMKKWSTHERLTLGINLPSWIITVCHTNFRVLIIYFHRNVSA